MYELDADTTEALGLDSTGRDGNEHFPYRLSDPWVWHRLRDALEARRDAGDWDSPESLRLEELESDACDFWTATGGA